MDANFWRQKWVQGDIAFHQSQVEPALVAHLAQFKLPTKATIFLPLCGKTLDIAWLQQQGYRIVGAELSELAIEQLFQSLDVTPEITKFPQHSRYRAKDIEIWVGDLFDLHAEMLGTVDFVYDRAALVALPAQIRPRYAAHLCHITAKAPQLLISFEYEQHLYPGPPFSVTPAEIQQLYGEHYQLHLLSHQERVATLKNKTPASISCWQLSESTGA